MDSIILIPAYKPNNELIHMVEELSQHSLQIVVVNDGSGESYNHIFKSIASRADIVHIPNNSGKGAALKHGMTHILECFPDCKHIVTADADGQHKVYDILRVVKELELGAEFVLTTRNFSKDMPLRSKVGNALSRYIYTILNSHYLPDNQSGLRGFSKNHLNWMVMVEGNKYDYEMNILYYADKQGITLTTIPIESIYIDNNSSSHFDPVADTLRIYARLFYSARVTFSTFFVVQPLLIIISILFGYEFLHITIPFVGASSVSVNLVLNSLVVFREFMYKDYSRVIMSTILRYFIYTFFVFFAKIYIPFLPMCITFNMASVMLLPLQYLFYKYTYLSKYKEINKN